MKLKCWTQWIVSGNAQLFSSSTMLSSLELKWRMLKCFMSNFVLIITTPQISYKHYQTPFPSSLQTTNLKLEKYLNLVIQKKKIFDQLCILLNMCNDMFWCLLKMVVAKTLMCLDLLWQIDSNWLELFFFKFNVT